MCADVLDLDEARYDRDNRPFTVLQDHATGEVNVVPHTLIVAWADGTVAIGPEHLSAIRPLLDLVAGYIKEGHNAVEA